MNIYSLGKETGANRKILIGAIEKLITNNPDWCKVYSSKGGRQFEYFDPELTRWAGALNEDEAFDVLKSSQDILGSRDQKVIKEFLFGNDKYERWTGYSVGYWLVKEFMKNNPNLSWDQIMKAEPRNFLETINK